MITRVTARPSFCMENDPRLVLIGFCRKIRLDNVNRDGYDELSGIIRPWSVDFLDGGATDVPFLEPME